MVSHRLISTVYIKLQESIVKNTKEQRLFKINCNYIVCFSLSSLNYIFRCSRKFACLFLCSAISMCIFRV